MDHLAQLGGFCGTGCALHALPVPPSRDTPAFMGSVIRSPRRPARLKRPVLTALMAGVFGCACAGSDLEKGTAPDPSPTEARSVCAECPVASGGESSDFGGTPHPCAHFEQRVTIDRGQASELGFDVDEIEQRVERTIDSPLRWRVRSEFLDGGAPPSGYRAATRIEGRARFAGWYVHVRLDAARCDGTSCFDPEVGELSCSDRLELGIEGDFRTLDDAVSVKAAGYLLQGRPGLSFEDPASTLRSNLRDVTGTLELCPDESLKIIQGELFIDLRLLRDVTEGEIRPVLLLHRPPATSTIYGPLVGTWPSNDDSSENYGGAIGAPEK